VRKVFHGNLKFENIFLTKNKKLKLGDFELVRIYDRQSENYASTLIYKAPE